MKRVVVVVATGCLTDAFDCDCCCCWRNCYYCCCYSYCSTFDFLLHVAADADGGGDEMKTSCLPKFEPELSCHCFLILMSLPSCVDS